MNTIFTSLCSDFRIDQNIFISQTIMVIPCIVLEYTSFYWISFAHAGGCQLRVSSIVRPRKLKSVTRSTGSFLIFKLGMRFPISRGR